MPFDVFQTDKFDLKTMISVSDQVTDQRVQFTMTTTPNALITKAGSLTVKNGKDFFSPETPTRGSITVSSFENPSTRMNFYVNFKKIDGDECLLWDVLQVDYSKVFLSLTYFEGDFTLEYPYESNWQACTFEYDSSRNKYILRYHRQYLQANTATNTVTLTPTLNSSCYWSLEGIFPDPEYGVKYRASFYYQTQTGRRYLYIASVDHDNNPSTPLIFETKLDNYKNYLYVTRTTMDDEDRLGLPLQYLAVPLTTDEANHMGEDVTFRSEPLGSVMYKLGAVNHYAVDARNEEYNQNEIFSALKGGRFVIFRGHGDAGKIVLKSSTVFTDHEEEDLHTVTAQEIFNRYNNSEDSLSNIDLLIWGSCCSADSQDAPHTNLVDVSFDVGAKIVVGFEGEVNRIIMNSWVDDIITLYADYCRNSPNDCPFSDYVTERVRCDGFPTTMNFDIVKIRE